MQHQWVKHVQCCQKKSLYGALVHLGGMAVVGAADGHRLVLQQALDA